MVAKFFCGSGSFSTRRPQWNKPFITVAQHGSASAANVSSLPTVGAGCWLKSLAFGRTDGREHFGRQVVATCSHVQPRNGRDFREQNGSKSTSEPNRWSTIFKVKTFCFTYFHIFFCISSWPPGIHLISMNKHWHYMISREPGRYIWLYIVNEGL